MANNALNNVAVFAHASNLNGNVNTTRNGVLPPDRTLQGANTQLLGPICVFLLE